MWRVSFPRSRGNAQIDVQNIDNAVTSKSISTGTSVRGTSGSKDLTSIIFDTRLSNLSCKV